MPTARLNGSEIRDWPSFHDVSARELGFPSFYGRNLNAWIDCLTYLDEGDGLSRFKLAPNEVLDLEVIDSDQMRRNAPDVLQALVDTTDAVKQRYLDRGKEPLLRLVLR